MTIQVDSPIRVLISDKMSPLAAEVFQKRGLEVDVKTGLSPEELAACIGDYHGLAIRSSTTATPEIIAKADNLKVIGRAGIGVDNIDISAASGRGIVVMNTPFGNSTTTAEHAISLMLSLARQIPEANASTHAGKWEKSKFMGVEVTGKTLGIIGCGNIGSIVIDRALGLKMKVIGFDPFLTTDRADSLGIKKVTLDELFAGADFITLHTPLNEKTRNIINADSFKKMRKGVRIINCARGGLIDETALKQALDDGTVAGAALDVFAQEPAKDNILFNDPRVIATPHLGASTSEAQENVAIQVAEQLSDYLLDGAVTNALNAPSLTAAEATKLQPFITLAQQLGGFTGQLTETGLQNVNIEYAGTVSHLNTKPLTAIILSEILKNQFSSVNMVSAAEIAKQHGIIIKETTTQSADNYNNKITVSVKSEQRQRYVAGTIFGKSEPRIIDVEGIDIEAAIAPHMLFIRNHDAPGFIGRLGQALGQANINIATFHLGRTIASNSAIALIAVDQPVNTDVIKTIQQLEGVEQVKALSF